MIELDEKKLRSALEGKSHTECLPKLVAYNGSLQIAHWKANTITNEHKALGELYDTMVGLVDDFAEVYIGKYNSIDFPPDAKIEDVTKKPCAKGLELVKEVQEYLTPGKDDDLLNIVADMSAALNKAKYLLKEK